MPISTSPFSRGATLRGPAVISLGGVEIRTKGDVKLTPSVTAFKVETSEGGLVDERDDQVELKLTFTPVGIVNANIVAQLWPWVASPVGTSMFGATDKALTVTPVTGIGKISLHAVAVTKMPDITIASNKTSIGEVEVTALLKNNVGWENAAARWTVETVTAPELTAVSPASILTYPARIVWGEAAPWATIRSREGVTFSFDMGSPSPDLEDENGIVDYLLGETGASCKFNPIGCGVADAFTALAAEGAGRCRGASRYSAAAALSVQASQVGGLSVAFASAYLKSFPLDWGLTANRFGDIVLQSIRTAGAVATVGVVAAA